MFGAKERGAIVPFMCVLHVLILGFVAYTVDVGRARSAQQSIQIAADAGSIAGALLVGDTSNTDSQVIERASLLAVTNGLTSEEIVNGGGISVGHWDVDTAT